MLIGDLDLERALRDPAYRRRVTAFLTGEPATDAGASEGEPPGEGPSPNAPAKPVPGHEVRMKKGAIPLFRKNGDSLAAVPRMPAEAE